MPADKQEKHQEKPGKAKPSRYTAKPSRYTPPTPRTVKHSPPWVPVVMFACFGLGVLIVILNYMSALPGDASNGYLFLGLGFVTAGFLIATQYK
jgi:hypothetical protein